jgi:hypothetical protein
VSACGRSALTSLLFSIDLSKLNEVKEESIQGILVLQLDKVNSNGESQRGSTIQVYWVSNLKKRNK